MNPEFIRNRITELRLQKGVSEYQMSYDLGHSRGYVYNISSGKCLPPMNEFLSICDYFGITPSDFFSEKVHHPDLIQRGIKGMEQLSEEDLMIVLNIINRLIKE